MTSLCRHDICLQNSSPQSVEQQDSLVSNWVSSFPSTSPSGHMQPAHQSAPSTASVHSCTTDTPFESFTFVLHGVENHTPSHFWCTQSMGNLQPGLMAKVSESENFVVLTFTPSPFTYKDSYWKDDSITCTQLEQALLCAGILTKMCCMCLNQYRTT